MLSIRRDALAVALLVLALTGCAPQAAPADDAPIDTPGNVPAECLVPFPQAFAAADPADLELTPAGWPAAPAEATLCLTAETADRMRETADYATTLSADDVLAHYEAALPDATRGTDGLGGPILFGTTDGIHYQVETREGSYRVVFAKADA